MGEGSESYGIDHIPELVDKSIQNIKKNHAHLLENGRIKMFCGDGRKGLPEHAPFDSIHVGAGNLYYIFIKIIIFFKLLPLFLNHLLSNLPLEDKWYLFTFDVSYF